VEDICAAQIPEPLSEYPEHGKALPVITPKAFIDICQTNDAIQEYNAVKIRSSNLN